MRLPRFSHLRPTELDEAVQALLQTPGAKAVAGGTDLLVNMKHRVELPPTLVSLRGLNLVGVREDEASVAIGACTTLKELQSHPLVAGRFPALTQAAAAVGSYRHQTMGTLGGNLCQNNRCRFFNQSWQWRQARSLCHKAGGEDCHVIGKKKVCYSAYSGDVAPALLVLDASARIRGPNGSRQVPLLELYSGDGKTPLTLEPGELLTEVVIPTQSAAGRSTYEKFSLRGAIEFPVVGAAAWRGNGSVRVAFTAVDRGPVRAVELEDFMRGRELTDEALQEAAPLALKAARVVPTNVHSVAYKRELMATLALRALRALF